MLDWIQLILGACFLIAGLITFLVELRGVFRFRYVLNRMHAAAIGDTLGISLSILGLMILSGWNFTTLKLGLVVLFLWCASPVSSHLLSRLEVTTNEELDQYCEVRTEPEDALQKENQEGTRL